MKARSITWFLLVLWGAWLFAVQGLLGAMPAVGLWVPDFGLLLLFSIDGRTGRREARGAALAIALCRISFSTDPPLAVLAGYLGAVWFFGALREILEIDRPLPRALLAGVVASVLTIFWVLCRQLALPSESVLLPPAETVWKGAATTAALALLFLPLFARLPGLSPLSLPLGRREP